MLWKFTPRTRVVRPIAVSLEAVGMVGFSPSTDARSSCRCFCIVDGLFVILWIIELVARFKNIVYLVIAIGIGIGFYFIHRNLLKTEKNNSVKPPLYHGGVRGLGRFNES
jgi:hypothetical protein